MDQYTSETLMHILKKGDCASLSGRSMISYQFGSDPEGSLAVQLTANTGGGKFNTDWISLSAIRQLTADPPSSDRLGSSKLRRLYPGKSTNSPAFLLAVLVAEAIVREGSDRDGNYPLGDIEAVQASISALTTETESSPVCPSPPPRTAKPKRGSKEKA